MAAAPEIDHTEFVRVLGTGAFATVWLARDTVLDRYIAIKILADNWSLDAEVERRFFREANVIISAGSRRLSQGYAVGRTADGRPYLAMSFADRGTLADRMTRPGRPVPPMPFHQAAAIVAEVALALVDVHALGHLHRDVKPSNVLLMSDARPGMDASVAGLASDERIVLGDFGLAKSLDSSALTLVAGSPGYAAPEQASGLVQLDARADLYPLGVILLELVSGREAPSATTMHGAASQSIDARATLAAAGVTLSRERLELIEALLSPERDRRPASATDVVRRLHEVAEDRHPEATSLAPRGRPPKRLVGLVVLVVVALVAVVLATRDGDDAPTSGTGITTESTDGPDSTIDDPVDGTSDTALAPLPPTAVMQADDELQRVADIAATVDDVIAFYRTGPDGWRIDGDIDQDEASAGFTIVRGGRSAAVDVAPAATSAGSGIVRIEIRYDR